MVGAMSVDSQAWNAIYFDISKVGSGTLKEAFWVLDHRALVEHPRIVRICNNPGWRLPHSCRPAIQSPGLNPPGATRSIVTVSRARQRGGCRNDGPAPDPGLCELADYFHDQRATSQSVHFPPRPIRDICLELSMILGQYRR